MINITLSQVGTNILSDKNSSQLVSTRLMTRNFNITGDYIECFVSDPSGKILASSIPCLDYTIPENIPDTSTIQSLVFSPEDTLRRLSIGLGNYQIIYNVLRPVAIQDFNKNFFIKEISSDRTELRISSNTVPISSLQNNIVSFIDTYQSTSYFKEFYVNFGNNVLIPAVNIALDNTTSTNSTILIKLLDPLSATFKVNDTISIVDAIADPITFNVEVKPDATEVIYPTLRGPNFDLDLDNLRVGPTPYYNFNQITNFQGDFAPQLQQLLGQLSASNFAINIDYTDYEDFVHFSSAARRLEGFQYKLQNIEYYTSQSSSAALSLSPSAQLDASKYQGNINKFIQSFDGWEQYLYYESGTYAWPKQNSTKPYINYSITSSQGETWYNDNYTTASLYDDNNQNYLLYTLPGFINENDDNELVFKFVASLGQMFDDIWIHIKAITDLYQAKNSLTEGISKDLVYFALQSMGIDVYTDQDNKNVFKYLYGINPDGSYKPITGSYDTLISASNYQLSGQDIQKGIYKRLYHNLPLLLKSKGTNRFIQYLNTIFGIPSTVMSYIEYGGVDKVTSSFEYEYDRFTYGLEISGSNTVNIPWIYTSQSLNRTGFNDITPNGIEFRFKAFTTSSNILLSSYPTQSLFYNSTNYNLRLLYTDTGSNDSIYSGSIGKFGYLQFNLGSTSITSSTVPVFTTGSDGETDWYTVLVQRRIPDRRIGDVGLSQTYDIYIKNNIWGQTGHIASASLTTSTQNTPWYTNNTTLAFGGGTFPFSGSIQEVRLWSYYISESAFDSHVLNPESIEGNYTTSSFNDLAARFTLGNNLYTYNHNVTTEVYSTHPDQKTQILTASFVDFPDQNNYSNFTETYYADVANSGYANPVVDKVRIYSGSEYGTQLLPNKSIEIPSSIPLTKDIHLLDASLSPQDEIDRAIIAQFGSTYDLDDIIGNPDTGSYSAFSSLQNEFFKKFNNKYNYKDYIRLIEFFHNSLFRTLKDFTPARTNLSTGIVIKPHLLERSAVYRPEPNVEPIGLLSTIDTAFITTSNGGNYNQPSYSYTIQSNIGPVNSISDGRDFYVGEFPSASISFKDVIVQDNPYLPFQNPLLSTVPPFNISSTFKLATIKGNLTGQIITRIEYNGIIGIYPPENITVNYDVVLNTSLPFPLNTLNVSYTAVFPIGLTSITDIRSVTPFGTSIASVTITSITYNDFNKFKTSDYNVLLNNISGSRLSTTRKKLTYITSESKLTQILEPVELQDFTYTYVRHAFPRYYGVKTTSQNYTFYTPGDEDVYGNNAAIDKNTVQFAFLLNAFATGSDLLAMPERTNLNIKYLIDENSNLTELTKRNYNTITEQQKYNLYQVQNIFKSGETLNVNLFDNQNPSRQSNLEGNKTIFAGGFRFHPILWKTGSYDLLYSVDPNFYPNGIPSTSGINNVEIETSFDPPGFFRRSRIKFRAKWKSGNTLNDVNIAYRITLDFGFGTVSTRTYNFFIPVGQQYSDWSPESKGVNFWYNGQILSVVNSSASTTINYLNVDFSASNHLSMSSTDLTNTIITCSAIQSSQYPNWFFSGSANNPVQTEYNFELKKGDLVRFADNIAFSSSNKATPPSFLSSLEYEIIDVYPPTGSSLLAFKIDRPIQNVARSSSIQSNPVYYRIPHYVFSSRKNDETNIVINHIKNPGETSTGTVKNINLSQNIDSKLANIVSELKSKIFSTFLTS